MSEEVRIDLKSTADTSGFDAINSAAKGANVGLEASAKSSKQLSSELGKSVEVGSATVGLFQNIATASQGGAAGLAAAARAGLGFGQMLKGLLAGAGPIGITLAAVGVAAGALVSIFSDSGKAAEEAKKKIEAINKLNLDSANEQQRLYGEQVQANIEKLAAEYGAVEKIADAELNRRKSAIDADTKLTPRQKEVAKLALDRQREDEKRSNALQIEGRKLGELEKAEAATAEAAAAATDEWLRQTEALRQLAAAQDAAKLARNMMLAQNGQGGSAGEYASAQARLREAEAAARGVDKSTVENRRSIAESAAQEANRAENVRRDQGEKYDLARKTDMALTPLIRDTRANEDRAKIEPTDAELAKRKQQEELKLWKLRQFMPAQLQLQVARGMLGADDARAAYPGVKFQDGPPAPAAAPLTPLSLDSVIPKAIQPAPTASNTIQRGGGSLPSDGASKDPRIQRALEKTTEATQQADTGEATAKQAEELKEVTEEHAAKVKESAAKTDAAMATAVSALSAASGVLDSHNGRLSNHDAEFRRVWGAINSLNSRRAA